MNRLSKIDKKFILKQLTCVRCRIFSTKASFERSLFGSMANKIVSLLLCTGAFFFSFFSLQAHIVLGVEKLFTPTHQSILKGQRIGLITNHTAVDSHGALTARLFKENAAIFGFSLVALFAPEHGLNGMQHAEEAVLDGKDEQGIPIYSLHGATRRPTAAMLKDVSLLVFDIQDIGSRSYTYISTLFYAMEEAARAKIPFVVLDRPNPLGGEMVDGPMLDEKWRSFVGYINVPYCHAMTVGELAQFFNAEYHVGCNLIVIPMEGWNRAMSFDETGLIWIPTSPQIPDAKTAFYYPTTGILGELQLVSIGVGYTLPFKVVGAPWIDAETFAAKLNEQKFSGVYFHPFHYVPFFGRFAKKPCHGVLIVITDPKKFLPVSTQFLIIGVLKSLYPKPFRESLAAAFPREEMFNKVNGTAEVLRLIKEEPFVVWKLRALHQKERQAFLVKRKKYLIQDYEKKEEKARFGT